MAKFLTTAGTSHHIEDIIIDAKESITLVTPYLQLSDNIIKRLKDSEKKNVFITIIYGKNEMETKQKNLLSAFKNIEIYFCKTLHAKCYFNENSLIISSMNLYEFSERNNREMGILINKNDDLEIYEDCLNEIQSIKDDSVVERKNTEKNIEKITKSASPYMPLLYQGLLSSFPENEIIFDKIITIKNFIKNGIIVEIGSSIDIRFFDEELYNSFKSKFFESKVINTLSPNARFYWNYYKLNIYLPKNFEIILDEKGTITSEYFIKTLNYLSQIWS